MISIIIPTFNRTHLIAETLDSVLSQTYQNWECIVVDDGSTDCTKELVESYVEKDSRFQYHQRPAECPKGANACRNYGFEKSSGEYIQWFDDDDVMLPNFLQLRISEIKNKSVLVTTGVVVNSKLEFIRFFRYNNVFQLYKQFALTKTEMITNSVFFKRAFLNNKSLFDDFIQRGQEAEFFSRIFYQLNNDDFNSVDSKDFFWRQHNLTKTTLGKNYVPKFKKNQTFVYASNLKRGIILQDIDIVYVCYKKLLEYLSLAARYRDFKNFKYIIEEISNALFKKNMLLVIQIHIFYFLLFVLKKESYTINKKFRKRKLKIS